MERLIEIGVREGEGQWEHFHKSYLHGNIDNDWMESLNKKCYGTRCGKHWREEIKFADPNYHGN